MLNVHGETTLKLSRKWPFLLREAQSMIAHHGKGLFRRDTPFKPSGDLKDYYDMYEQDGGVHSSIDSLVGTAVGRGFDLDGDDDKAIDLCNDWAEGMNLDDLNPNICREHLIAGFCPVETVIDQMPEKSLLQIIHPPTVKDLLWNKEHTKPVQLVQKVGDQERKIMWDELTWFSHNKIGNDPYGQSMIKPVLTLLHYRQKAITDMDRILERYGSPKGIWKSQGPIESIMEAVTQGERAGEDLFLGNLMPENMDPGRLVEFLQIDPRVRFWEYIQYMDQLIYVGMMAPNLFYFKDATYASSVTLLEITDRVEYAVSRVMKRQIEKQWFKPLCDAAGYKEVPRIKWRQKPPQKDLHLPELLAQGIAARFLSRDQYYEILQNAFNITFDTEYKPDDYLMPQQPVGQPQVSGQTPKQEPPLPQTAPKIKAALEEAGLVSPEKYDRYIVLKPKDEQDEGDNTDSGSSIDG